MNMFDAIFNRKSIRHFEQETIEWEVISDILEFANSLPPLVKGIPVEFKLVSNIEKKQGFHGLFSVKAPYYLCISSEEEEDYLLNAGYLMQQLNLYIAAKGLGACFLGAARPGKELKSTMKYRYVIALAFGKTKENLYRDCTEADRLAEVDTVVYKENVSSDVKQIVYGSRLAPSSMNSQPWRLVVYSNRIHVFARKNIGLAKIMNNMRMVDMGIMLSNLIITADELWAEPKMIKSDVMKSKSLQRNDYVCTITIA